MKINISKVDIPNLLTLFRIVSAPVFIWIFYLDTDLTKFFASVIFILAGITDILDGYLARQWNVQSIIGKILDPIADKLIVIVAIVMLMYIQRISGINVFAAFAILMREIVIAGLREALICLGFEIPVSSIGKWKTALQITAISILLCSCVKFISNNFPFFEYIEFSGMILLWIAAGLSLYSGFQYTLKGFRFLKSIEKVL